MRPLSFRNTVVTQNRLPMHIAIVTAGGAGMFGGSCMHDNTWARTLKKPGRSACLPTYTPSRLDEQDESTLPCFSGGINVYLDFRARFWRTLPRVLHAVARPSGRDPVWRPDRGV